MTTKKEYSKAYYDANKERVKEYRDTNRERTKEYRSNNREKFRVYRKTYEIKKRYGLTLDEYEAILARGCEVCGTHDGKLCLDHDHNTGRVRGCLCHSCNTALGHLKDSRDNIINLLLYLEINNGDSTV